jgi:hypothetical protein
MNEGFFSSLFQGVKAVGAGLKAAGSEAGKQVGDAGGALGASFIAAAQKVAAPIKQASDAAKESIANIADKGLKAAAASSAKSIKDSLQPIIIDQLTTLVKKFQAAGSSEEQAKEQARGIVQAAVITAIGY